MTVTVNMTGTGATGFHEGELAVQRRAGTASEAGRLAGMLAPPDLSGGAGRYLAGRDFAVLAARDAHGTLWTAPLSGAPGFLAVGDATTLHVTALPSPEGPLAGLVPGTPAGLLVIDFATRRRLRVNGTVTSLDAAGFDITADQAFGNCPRYIQRRVLDGGLPQRATAAGRPAHAPEEQREPTEEGSLTPAARRLIEAADTFVLGTVHPTRGADASHRGGPRGFVRVESDTLWWPDYPGNNLFNSLGNLAVDPTAALLFIDFATGETLQLSGRAQVEWLAAGGQGDDGGTGRRVRFHPDRVRTGRTTLRATPAPPAAARPPAP